MCVCACMYTCVSSVVPGFLGQLDSSWERQPPVSLQPRADQPCLGRERAGVPSPGRSQQSREQTRSRVVCSAEVHVSVGAVVGVRMVLLEPLASPVAPARLLSPSPQGIAGTDVAKEASDII